MIDSNFVTNILFYYKYFTLFQIFHLLIFYFINNYIFNVWTILIELLNMLNILFLFDKIKTQNLLLILQKKSAIHQYLIHKWVCS